MTQPIPAAEELIPNPARECGEHRPTIGRSWCFEDKEWCYPDIPCRGCELPALRAEVERLRFGQPWEELFRQRDEALTERDRLRAHILDIDAHATPYGDIPDEPGYVGTYLVTAGALHRALGKVGHSVPSCEAEAERDRLREQITEAEAVIVRAQDALGVDHPVWVILDDYDGSMDSVKALVRERDDARLERDRYAEVVEAAQQWREMRRGRPAKPLPELAALVAAVDRLTPGDET